MGAPGIGVRRRNQTPSFNDAKSALDSALSNGGFFQWSSVENDRCIQPARRVLGITDNGNPPAIIRIYLLTNAVFTDNVLECSKILVYLAGLQRVVDVIIHVFARRSIIYRAWLGLGSLKRFLQLQLSRKETTMRTGYKLLAIAALAAANAGFSMSALADNTSKADYRLALKTAKASYDTAYTACPAPKGPERLACRRQAHADWEKAKADAREAHGMPRFASGPRN